MPQPVEVDRILVPKGDRQRPCHHYFEHCMSHTIRIAAIRNRLGQPPAHPEMLLRFPQQQQTAVRRLGAAVEIHCELLAVNGWKVERKRRIFGHGGCGVALMCEAVRLNTDLLRESVASRHNRRKILQPNA